MLFKLITTIAATVPFFVLAAKIPNPRGKSDGIVIPLTKRFDTDARKFHATSHNTKIIREPSDLDDPDSEWNTGMPHPSAVQQDGPRAGVDLIKHVDGIWYGTIWIGTPPQSFTVQFNTGSSDFYVPAVTGDKNCRSHPALWDPASFHNTDLDLNEEPASPHITNVDLDTNFEILLADGRLVSGKQYTDNVTIAGFIADVQTIGAATTCHPPPGSSKFPPDGVLGLAFPSYSHFHGQSPLLHTLFKEGKLSEPVFSLTISSFGGELYLGGTNEEYYSPSTLVFTPVINPVLWQLKIDNIKIGGEIVVTDIPAVIDTGADLIIGDPRRVLAIHRAAGGGSFASRGMGTYYTIPCSSFPSMTFTIGGRLFVMPAHVLNKGPVKSESGSCFSGIATAEKYAGFWSIGTIFLERFYTVFDFNSESPRVGFAELYRPMDS